MTLSKLIWHPSTLIAVSDFINHPTHALLITGPGGSGKASTAQHIVSEILHVPTHAPNAITEHPYIRIVRPVDNKAISIETVRDLQHFLHLKVPSSATKSLARAVVIEDAHTLTIEAQNSLLKTLEEPPGDTLIVLTATSRESVLPTIQSRVRQLALLQPPSDALAAHFTNAGYRSADIQRTLMLSGELPGLTAALLAQDTEHPLVAATTHARGILQSKTYERLLLVDSLSKQRQLCLDVLFVMGRMSRMAVLKTADPKSSARWRAIMASSYAASEQLQHNAQTKLVLTNLMLTL